eukprot:scaffold197011_cov89-Cyclotella_meneghiniana.AAC.1
MVTYNHLTPQSKLMNQAHKSCPGFLLNEFEQGGTVHRSIVNRCICHEKKGNPGKYFCQKVTRAFDSKNRVRSFLLSLAARAFAFSRTTAWSILERKLGGSNSQVSELPCDNLITIVLSIYYLNPIRMTREIPLGNLEFQLPSPNSHS